MCKACDQRHQKEPALLGAEAVEVRAEPDPAVLSSLEKTRMLVLSMGEASGGFPARKDRVRSAFGRDFSEYYCKETGDVGRDEWGLRGAEEIQGTSEEV